MGVSMGARGRLKIATDPTETVAAAAAGTAAAQVPAAAPNKPASVAENEQLSALWDQIVPELDRAGLIAPSDALAIEVMLRHYLAIIAASEKLLEEGPVEHDEKNQRRMKNPAEVVFRSESETFLKYANAIGMTFVSRARTPSMGEGEASESPFGS